jgi:uncharacterized damage-inducible protein DinB
VNNYDTISAHSLLDYWREVRADIQRCLAATPENLLSWAPQTDMKTIGQLFVHLATAVDWNMTNVVGDGGEWVHSDKLPSDDRKKLSEHLNKSFERLERLISNSDLTKTYKFKNKTVTGAWLMIHLFEHDIHHRAQIKAYLRQNGITPPETF